MNKDTANRHSDRSAKTRLRFIRAAQKLFAQKSIDAVSLNEITVAAGQKNRNALQYHFGGRDALLQAIIDHHAARVRELRAQAVRDIVTGDMPPARAAALGLVRPLTSYVQENPEGIYYVKLLSQLAAQSSPLVNPDTRSGLTFQREAQLKALFTPALAHLSQAEAQQRLFLTLSITFHAIADVCRVSELRDSSPRLQQREQLFQQITLSIERLLSAPALDASDCSSV